MTTIWTYVLLVVGFVLLIKGADFFVEGSSGIAKKLKVPSLIIGLTIVAMGTSLPECAVSVAASISGNNALAVSNVVGSNIFNLMVVCGFCAVITPLAVGKRTLKQEFPFSVLMAALLLRRSAAAAHGGSSALFFPLYINTIKLGEILFFYAEFFEKIQSRFCGRGASPSPYNTTLHEAVGADDEHRPLQKGVEESRP